MSNPWSPQPQTSTPLEATNFKINAHFFLISWVKSWLIGEVCLNRNLFFPDGERVIKELSMQRIKNLTDLLTDAYDDNRQLALDILTHSSLKSHVKKIVSIF